MTGKDSVCLILGDNIFYGLDFPYGKNAASLKDGAVVFGYQVKDPERFGVVEFDKDKNAISIEEKTKTKIKLCCNWIYFMIIDVVEIAKM